MSIKATYLFVIASLFLSACSNTKHLPAGDSLFIGSKVHINDKEVTSKQRKVLRGDLNGAVRPRHNTEVLGVRLKLTLYNIAGEPKKKKGLRTWLRNKVGEPPVLGSTFDLEKNKLILANVLENKGFFFPTVTGHAETTKKRKTTAIFDVITGPQYLIDTTIFPTDSSLVSTDIALTQEKTLLKVGQPYNLDLIKAERERIDRALKERGYYFFTPDYLLIKADTAIGDHKVRLYVTVKEEGIPYQAFNIYDIGKVYIYPNFKLRGKAEDTSKENAVLYKGYYVVDPKKTFKPYVFSQAMQFSSGEEYNKRDQNTSLNRLVSLNTFKFVKNRFDPLNDSTLDVYYYLTPFPRKSLQFQIGGLTQNDSRYGSNASISWKNRNAFHGAEELVFKVNGGFETQYAGDTKRPNIYHTGAEVNLSIPRFLVPFLDIKGSSYYIPRTIIKGSYNFESQSDLLRINSYKVSYGYNWKEDVRKDHQLFPINFTYVHTDTLGRENLNLYYGNLIFNGIIIGPTYEYTYNSQAGSSRRNNLYFNGLIDLSGNILGLAEKADYTDNPKTLFGSTYAQYVKMQVDARHYFNFFPGFVFANRLLIGFGYPYGNSAALPNVKQFFSGGNSSLRGFRSRLVGPGTFNEKYLYGTNNYIETLGDMKVEGNSELRIKIYNFLNAGAFVDAGNIWLLRDNPAFPGGKFTSESYKELAADVGIGLRLDFKILLLRLDLGMPIRKPWLPDGERWVFNKINFGDGKWRGENLIFNLAIGYPF